MELITKNIENITTLCEKHFVVNLFVFGSILTNKFNKESDVDFLVEIAGVDPFEYFDNYMDLKEELEQLLNRNIDLVEIQTLKNPILKTAIDQSKKLIYGQSHSKVAC